jgi:menaquinol-cytochrome c reductase iron-sulfur subunit
VSDTPHNSQTPDNSSDKASANQRPDAATASPEQARRRKFLTRITLGLGAISMSSILWAVLGFIIAPITHKNKPVWRKVGAVDDFPVGSTKVVTFENANTVPWGAYAGHTAAWLRREDQQTFTCFSVNCTHLGCPVRWEQGSELFMCPCHGGVYYRDGQVAAGPPPKSLPRYSVRIRGATVEIEATGIPITQGV